MAQLSHVALLSAGIGPPVIARSQAAYSGGSAASDITLILCRLGSLSLPDVIIHLFVRLVCSFRFVDGYVLSDFKDLR